MKLREAVLVFVLVGLIWGFAAGLLNKKYVKIEHKPPVAVIAVTS
jgi:hypothetical protein